MDIASSAAGKTVPSRFLECVAPHADATALRARREDGTYWGWTYREYAERVARCAAGLEALGFGPGQRLVLMLRNRPEFHVLDSRVSRIHRRLREWRWRRHQRRWEQGQKATLHG